MLDHATDSFDTLVEGVTVGCHTLLDNMGITVKLTACPSWPLWTYSKYQMFGRGRLSASWCYWVRPWLMPRRQAEIEAAYDVARGIFQQELLNETIERGREVIED